MSEKTEFEKAFAAARKACKITFTFKGISYNTKRKDQQPKITHDLRTNYKKDDSWLEKMHKKVFPSKYKDTEKNRKKRAETMKKVEANKKKKKLGGFRNTGADWIESPDLNIFE